MEMLKFKDFCRFIIYAVWILALYAIEQMPGVGITELEIRPFLVMSAFVSVALFEREYTAMIFGIFCGFLIDMSFGTPPGCFAVVFCVLGYVIGVLTSYFYNVNILSIAISILMFFLIIATVYLRNSENFMYKKRNEIYKS